MKLTKITNKHNTQYFGRSHKRDATVVITENRKGKKVHYTTPIAPEMRFDELVQAVNYLDCRGIKWTIK